MSLEGIDVPSVLPYLSPRKKQLSGPIDLLDYWVQANEKNPMEDPLAAAYYTGQFPRLEEVELISD